MARRRRGRALDGILVLDKPAGMSSNQALQRVKRLYDAAKAGHQPGPFHTHAREARDTVLFVIDRRGSIGNAQNVRHFLAVGIGVAQIRFLSKRQ